MAPPFHSVALSHSASRSGHVPCFGEQDCGRFDASRAAGCEKDCVSDSSLGNCATTGEHCWKDPGDRRAEESQGGPAEATVGQSPPVTPPTLTDI